MVYFEKLEFAGRGNTEIRGITVDVLSVVRKSGVREGRTGVCVEGSTAGITSMEYEPGLVRELKEMWRQH